MPRRSSPIFVDTAKGQGCCCALPGYNDDLVIKPLPSVLPPSNGSCSSTDSAPPLGDSAPPAVLGASVRPLGAPPAPPLGDSAPPAATRRLRLATRHLRPPVGDSARLAVTRLTGQPLGVFVRLLGTTRAATPSSTASTTSTSTSATSALRGYHLLDKPLRLPFQPQHLLRIDGCDCGGMSSVRLILQSHYLCASVVTAGDVRVY